MSNSKVVDSLGNYILNGHWKKNRSKNVAEIIEQADRLKREELSKKTTEELLNGFKKMLEGE